MMSPRSAVLLFLLALIPAIPVAAQDIRVESYQGRDAVAGEILVRFRGATSTQSQAIAAQDVDIAITEPVGQSGAVVLRSRGRSVSALLQAYQARLDVEYAEPNYMWTAHDLPNDAFFNQQWGMQNTGQIIQGIPGIASADIKARQAWDITEGSRNIVVGIVDTGVDYTHPDLIGNMWYAPRAFTVTVNGKSITCAAGTHGFNAIRRDCDPLDDEGHGTHVAGIIGASGNNGAGVSGVNRVASMMAFKFLGATGSGTTVDAIAAIDFALQVKALFGTEANIRALNNSWGGGGFSQALMDEITLLNAAEVMFVASAGNAGLNNDLSVVYPTNYALPNVFSVAATDNRDALAGFSDWGPTSVELAAPGVNVLSTIPGGLYGFNSGTSMAAPQVTGAIALVLSVCPLTTAGVKGNLLGSVDEVPSLTERTLTAGRLNIFKALSNCVSQQGPAFSLSATPGIQSIVPNGTTSFTVTATALRGFTGTISLSAPALPQGLSASFDPAALTGGGGTSTMTIRADSLAANGTNTIVIAGSSPGLERRTGVSVNLGFQVPPIGLNQTVAGALTPADRISQNQIGSYADHYQLTLSAPTVVTIDLKAGLFDAFLYVLSPSGSILFSSDNVSFFNSRITANLPAGVYTIEATTTADGQIGPYTLSINTPTISTISPRVINPGSTSTVSFTGTRFTAPMTITAGDGITVSNVTVISTTLATATVTVAADAAPGPRDISVSTIEGTSNPMAFPVPTRIQPGQVINGTVSTTDLLWPYINLRYTDIYQLTLNATTAVTLDVRSTGFDAVMLLFDSNGILLLQEDDSAGPNADRISATLGAGTYYLEVTSAFVGNTSGNYVLAMNMPALSAVSPRFMEVGSTAEMVLFGNRFAFPMTVNAGDDIVVTDMEVIGSTLAFATATSVGTTTGLRAISVNTPAGSTNAVPFRVVPQIPTIGLGETVSGSLSQTDPAALDIAGAYMDLYRFTLTASTRVTIDLQSAAINMNLLVLSSSTGLVAFNDDSNGGRNASISTTLAAGTYFIEATSSLDGEVGDYVLTLNSVPFGLTTVTPRFGVAGTTITANLTGVGFASPMSIDAGLGITVSNLVINNSTSATATFTIADNATPGPRAVTVNNVTLTTSPQPFTVYAASPIALGETRNGVLGLTDLNSPNRAGSYGDLHRLTLFTPASVAIAVNSTAFNAFAYIMTPSGTVLGSDDSSGGSGNARIALVLDAGTYLIDATSFAAGIGAYTLSITTTPTTLNFPRAFTPAEFASTRFSVVNPGLTEAKVNFTMYDSAGAIVSTAVETIATRAQLSKLGTEILQGVDRSGWLQATSDSIGLEALWLGGDGITTMDGAKAAPETGDLLFPMVTPQTEFSIANVGPGVNVISLLATNNAGGLLAIATRILQPNAVLRITLSNLFVGFPGLPTITSLRVTGALRITGTSVVPDFPSGPSMTVLNGVDAGQAGTTAAFPHVITGSGWNSTVGVTNVSTNSSQLVTLTFTPTTGSPLNAFRVLGPRATLRESLQTMFGLTGTREGWLRVSGSSQLAAYVVYGLTPTAGATIVPGQASARTTQLFEHVASGPNWGTGLALANPSTTADANVVVYVLRKTGALVGRFFAVVPRGGKMSTLVSEMIPGAVLDDGFIYVESNIPVFGEELIFNRDLRAFSNVVPDGPDPGVIYVPPSQ